MKPIILLLIIKIIALFAAIASTLGVLSFFFFESLHPYRWQLLVGGLVTIAITEGLSHLVKRQISRDGSGLNQ